MENVKKENYLLVSIIIIGIMVIMGLVLQWNNNVTRSVMGSNPNQGIMVTGEGTLTVKPDIARVSLGVEAEATTAEAAQQKNSKLMANIITSLKNLGLLEKDIQTTDFNLAPDRRYDKTGREQLVGYRAMNQVTIIVRDLTKLGEAIDQSIKAGANNVNNVSFSVESPAKWREEAITKAIKDARSKAETMAKASGVKIRKISSINESTIDVRPYQMEGFRNQAFDAKAVSTPIEPGNVKIMANVQMNFEI